MQADGFKVSGGDDGGHMGVDGAEDGGGDDEGEVVTKDVAVTNVGW